MTTDTLINLSSDNYDMLMIVYIYSLAIPLLMSSTIIERGKSFILSTTYQNVSRFRQLNYITNTQYKSSNGSVGTTTDNTVCIPIAIYGIKLHHTVEIKAIAPSVSTLAENCVFDPTGTDLESTNVEDVIKELETNFQAGVDDIYDAVVAKGSTPASHSLSDVVRGIEDIETGITPSGTYTYPSGSTGGTVDVTNYAKVNAANVYAKGKADAAITFTTQTKYVTGTQGAATSKTLTYTFSHKILGITNLRTNYSDGVNRNPEQFYTVSVTGANTVKYTGSLQNQNGGTVGITCIGY